MTSSSRIGAPAPSVPAPTRRAPFEEGSYAVGLRCAACGARRPLGDEAACPECLGPLVLEYDLDPLVGSDPRTLLAGRDVSLWRYRELLPPVPAAITAALPVGPSPLRRARQLGSALGIDELWIKDETTLPSGSFKDRPASVAAAWAVAHGYSVLGCASTGNLAAATARAAALLGCACCVFVPEGLTPTKVGQAIVYGAAIAEVSGPYDAANRVANLAAQGARLGLVNINLRPYYAEGSKTLWYEVAESLDWQVPDATIVPLGSGALLAATFRAAEETRRLGWLARDRPAGPRLYGSQPAGCAPIAEAFLRGDDRVIPVEAPQTIAESLAIGDPASAEEALRALHATGGGADVPGAEEVRHAIRELARLEGLWAEPAGGTTLATLRRLRAAGTIRRSDRVVAYLTGAGWKTPRVALPLPTEGRVPQFRIDPHSSDVAEWAVRFHSQASISRLHGEGTW